MSAVPRHHLALSLVVAASLSSACITGGPRRTTPDVKDNGAPLEVKTIAVPNTYGDTGIPDGTFHEAFDGFYQGKAPVLDELDFYALAQDADRQAKVVAWREQFNTALYASYAAQAVGAAVVAGGIGVGAYGFIDDPDNVGSSNFYYAAIGLVIGGSIIVGGAPSTLFDLLGPETELDRNFEKTPLVLPWVDGELSADEANRRRAGGTDATPTDAPGDGPAATVDPGQP